MKYFAAAFLLICEKEVKSVANERVFDQRAEHYDRARPGYAPAAVQCILQKISEDAVVADIGAGTGIWTQELLRYGAETYAIEPNEQMRQKLEKNLGKHPKLHIVAAAAEHTGLPDKSMDLVTAASAFHWFDADAFLQECRRILKREGIVCLFINGRDYSDAFTQKQHALCLKYCPGFSSLTHGLEKTERAARKFFGERLHKETFAFPLHYTKERFIERSLSSSYSPDPQDPRYGQYKSELRSLLDEWFCNEEITLGNHTVLFWGSVN